MNAWEQYRERFHDILMFILILEYVIRRKLIERTCATNVVHNTR